MQHYNGTQYWSTELIFPFLQTNITSQMWPSGCERDVIHSLAHCDAMALLQSLLLLNRMNSSLLYKKRSPLSSKINEFTNKFTGVVTFFCFTHNVNKMLIFVGEQHDCSDVNITSPGKGCARSKFTCMISIHLQSSVPKIIKIRAYL